MTIIRIRSCFLKFNLNSKKFIKYLSTSSSDSEEFIEHTSRNGYKGESYDVKTKDGYHLKLHKICAIKQNSPRSQNIFLMHGLARHSMDYLASGRQVSLAYYLADSGFDVWLGNSRDTKMCYKHDKHSLLSTEFLNYNIHDIGIYDIPALLDFVLNRTSDPTISYVGHSQGCGALLILLSTMPEFNCYINQAHLLTPAALLGDAKSPILTYSAKYHNFTNAIYDHFKKISISPILETAKEFNKSSSHSVKVERARNVYEKITCSIIGKNKFGCQISEDALACFQDLITPYWSTTHLRHFLQLHMTGKFQQFDYGLDKNVQIYNSPDPPEYNLQNVTAPIYLYSASEDLLVDPKDVEKLKTLLPNVKYYENIKDWNHMDVLLGKNARKVLYEKILTSLNE